MKAFIRLMGTAVLSLALVACGGQEEEAANDTEADGGTTDIEIDETSTIVVGATSVPHAEILEQAVNPLKEQDIELVIEEIQEYALLNRALSEGNLDANYFQHEPYLLQETEEFGYDLVNVGGVHIEPIGVYSQKHDSLEELPDGAEILMSSSITDHGRILKMLEEQGLITLKEGTGDNAALEDIEENRKDLQFNARIEPSLLAQAYLNGEGDAVLINSNYAIDNGIDPMKDSIAMEAGENNPYANLLVVRSGDENNDTVQALLDVLRSEEIQSFIIEQYNGAVIPVTE
ncbi:MetQ/NlpA family ABC transporter substrate-binding protein [Bacillus solitudinis]|uniref:MetQ/NlpA family ABC transporter substrate-binding protein n=1 Tax=Bacillus solitudinis TaxID=2014074 RepID=UPI000C248CDB|nr:MetQ/NlpA family ABC transporter substrate-binding protein [Bacillus solitudinis]